MPLVMTVRTALVALLVLPLAQPHAATPATGELSRESMQSAGLKRQYWVRLPRGDLKSGDKRPLVIVLHGGGGTGKAMAEALQEFPAADRDQAILVYPDAHKRTWNDGEPGKTKRGVDDVAFLSDLIDEMVRSHGADRARVYLIGISNGAGMASRMLCERSGKLTAVAMAIGQISEIIYPGCRPARPVSVMMFNGTADPVVPYAGGAVSFLGMKAESRVMPVETTIKLWARMIGADPARFTITTLPTTHPDDGMPVQRWHARGTRGHQAVLYRIEGAGHTWPNGPQYLPQWVIGKVKHNLDTKQLAWDFLMRERVRHSEPSHALSN